MLADPGLVLRTLVVAVVLLAVAPVRVSAEPADESSNPPSNESALEEYFEKKVRPLLAERCFGCHAINKPKGGLRLDSAVGLAKGSKRGPVVVPGDPGSSVLIQVVRHEGDLGMPPKTKLRSEEIAVLVKWVKDGAYWPNQAASLQRAENEGEDKGRVFTEDDKNFWAYQPLRNAEPPEVAASNRTRSASPVDRFILQRLEQDALSLSPEADKRTLLRRVTFDFTGLPPTPDEIEDFVVDPRPDAFDRAVDRLLASPHYGERWGRHWLDVVRYGESAGHDGNNAYFFAWRYRDYVIDAFNRDKPFDQFIVEQIAGDLLPKTGDRETDYNQVVGSGFLQVGPKPVVMRDKHQMLLDIADEQIHTTGVAFLGLTLACARCHDHKFDPIPTKDYYSLAGIFMSTHVMADFIADSKWLEYEVETTEGDKVQVMAVKDQPEPADLKIHVRGNYRRLGDSAPRRFLQIVAGENHAPIETEGSGRLELAKWIAGPKNPLTGRVLVNRLWQWHFGTGLVASSGDFGRRGGIPSHPDLLDWLAGDFLRRGWSIKQVQRRIVLSSTYRQAHGQDPVAARVDPTNRLLWRMPRRRLTAEEIRDGMLAISGQLDNRMGGGLFNFMTVTVGGDKKRLLYAIGKRPKFTETYRSVYLAAIRNFRPEFVRLFDAANEHEPTTRRKQTTVAPQSLYFMNSTFVRDQAMGLARDLCNTADTDHEELARLAYLKVLGREPSPDEIRSSKEFLDDYVSLLDPDGSRVREYEKAKAELMERRAREKALSFRRALWATGGRAKTHRDSYSDVIQDTPGLVAYYGFEGNTDPSASAVSAALRGKARATYHGAPNFRSPGAIKLFNDSKSQAVVLGKAGQRVEVANGEFFNFESNKLSVEYWILPFEVQASMVVGRDTGRERLWKSGVIPAKVDGKTVNVIYHQFFSSEAGAQRHIVKKATVAPVGSWTHVVFTYGEGRRRLFVNGVLADKVEVSADLLVGTSPFTIGASARDSELFKGLVDEVSVYDVELRAEEVRRHYESAGYVAGEAPLLDFELKRAVPVEPQPPLGPLHFAWRAMIQALLCTNEFIYVD